MIAKFPILNWFSSVLAGTVTLITLGGVVPEAAQGESITSQIAQMNRSVPQNLYNTGQTSLEQHNYQQALTYFNQAIAINGEYAQAYQGRALARDAMGDSEGAVADLRTAASFYWKQGNALAAYEAIRLIEQMGKKFVCRQSGGQWQTVMNLKSKTYPLIIWHDRRVWDVDGNGNPVFLGQDSIVTTTRAEKNTELSAQGRCASVSERLNSISDALMHRGAQHLFRVATLERTVEESTRTGQVLTLEHKIQVACIPDIQGVCDRQNAIFTLTGQPEGEGVTENNQKRLERLTRLIDHPGSGEPIHN